MSYDLHYFRWDGEGDPGEEAARLAGLPIEERAPLTGEEISRLKAALERAQAGWVEEDGSGAGRLSLFQGGLATTVLVSSSGVEMNAAYFRPHSAALLAMMAELGRALSEEGYVCFDPQKGQIVDWARDQEAMRAQYDAVAGAVRLDVEAPGGTPKPWWKFW